MAETKTCGDCIHTDICKEVVGSWFSTKNFAYCKGFKDRTNYVEVVHGEWERVIPSKSAAKWSTKVSCSNCHKAGYTRYNFCPNCGANMDGERKGDDATD